MRKMSLWILLLCFFAAFFVAPGVQARSQQVYTLFSLDSKKGELDPLNTRTYPYVTQQKLSLGYAGENLFYGLDFSAALSAAKPDYSNIYLRRSDGSEKRLSDQYPDLIEKGALVKLGRTWSSHYFSLQVQSTFAETPYTGQSAKAEFREGSYAQTTVLGMSVAYLLQRQPASLYIDRNYQTRSRPTLIHGNEVAVSIEQILTERWKALLELSTSRREEERPRNFGVRLRQGLAVFGRLYSQLELTHYTEFRNQTLQDERGYFTLQSGQLTLITEPMYDLLLSASYGLVREMEKDPRINHKVQVGSDQFGAGIKWLIQDWELSLNGSQTITNTPRKAYTCSGGLTCKF